MRKNYRGLKIVIVGLGITGLSCVNFFLSKGVIPKITDTRLCPPEINKLPYFIEYCFGRLHDIWILQANLIVISPGVRLFDSPVLIEARQLGIEIVGDIELFAREVINTPIVAITGSNGKSTVTQLVGKMAQCAGWIVGIAGNIGIPVLSLLNKRYQLYVLEISSFQLDVTYSLNATAAIILNISEDHMDRYPGGLNQYALSKKKIYHNATICIVNDSDPLTVPIVSKKYAYIIRFGVNSSFADYRVEYYKRCNWIVVHNKYLFKCCELKMNNYMNFSNILSALALSDSVRIPQMASLKALQHFCGLSHRFQLIYRNNGVIWINDSKATNVAASKEAVNSTMRILSGRLHLLLGGDGKSADFSKLECIIKLYDINLYCFGKDGLFLTRFGSNHIFLTKNMIEAMYVVSRRVRKKDIVLLSPACSSLDQFKSFQDRGNIFVYFAKRFG